MTPLIACPSCFDTWINPAHTEVCGACAKQHPVGAKDKADTIRVLNESENKRAARHGR
jgi:hypothetical protein